MYKNLFINIIYSQSIYNWQIQNQQNRGNTNTFNVSIEKKSCGKRTKLYIAYTNESIPSNVKIPCRKLFVGLCFLSLSTTAYNAEINTQNETSNISTHKSNVQNPIRNSITIEIATLSFLNFLKKHASLASSMA